MERKDRLWGAELGLSAFLAGVSPSKSLSFLSLSIILCVLCDGGEHSPRNMDVKCPASCLVDGNCRWWSSSAFSEEEPDSPLSITEAG